MKVAAAAFILLSLILLQAGCGSAAPAAPSNISPSPSASPSPVLALKIGSLPRIFDLSLYAAQQDGVFSQNNIKVEIVPFRSVVERNNAFLAGAIDGFVDSVYEAINLNQEADNCRVVGHNLMPDMFELIVASGSGITQPGQLKGKDIATSTGTIMEYALDRLLADEGISPREVSYVNVPAMPLRLEMLAQGKVPAAIMTPPLSAQAIASGNRLLLDDRKQLLAGPAIIFSSSTLKGKSAGVSRFVQSWQQTARLINAAPASYRPLLVSTAQIPEGLANTYSVPIFPQMRLPLPSEINQLSDWMKSKGMIKSSVPFEKVVDTNYLK